MDVIETLQARINKLEVKLSRIAGMAEQGAKMAKNDMDKRGFQRILRTVEAALTSVPMPTIEVDPALPPGTLKIGDLTVTNIGTPDLTDDEIEIAKAEMDAFYGRTEDDEHGVEPGGTCPNCGHTDAGCVCERNSADIMKVAKLTDAQAKVIGYLITDHYRPGAEINPLDVFPWRDAEGNGLRRTLNKLGKDGILGHAAAYPSHIQIWQMTQEAIDAYRAWYHRRGFKLDINCALLD